LQTTFAIAWLIYVSVAWLKTTTNPDLKVHAGNVAITRFYALLMDD